MTLMTRKPPVIGDFNPRGGWRGGEQRQASLPSAPAWTLAYDGGATDLKVLAQVARHRAALHRYQASHRPLSLDYELIGLIGQYQFVMDTPRLGLALDLTDKTRGDKHNNFKATGRCYGGATHPVVFCVKTSTRAFNLVAEVRQAYPEFIIQYSYNPISGRADFVGWEYFTNLRMRPTRDFGGVMCHYIPAGELRDLAALEMVLALRQVRGPRRPWDGEVGHA